MIKKLCRKTYVIDISILPEEYKKEGGTEAYEEKFNIKILPIDLSPKNVMSGTKEVCFFKV